MPSWLRSRANELHWNIGFTTIGEAREAEMETMEARIDAIANDNRRLTDERDRALVVARELRINLNERDLVVTSLASRLADLLATWVNRNEISQDLQEAVRNIGGQLAGFTGQLGGLAAECAQMRSRDVDREFAIRESRERLSAWQDEIQAVISRLSGTVDYLGMVRRVRAYTRRLLPPAARIIIISKGDPDLLELEGQEGWHFPQDDLGNYAGHYPAESEDAIAHLEALRARGAGFLVIPSSASWWLEHYGGLARHLDASYQMIWKSADCQIYELAGPDRSRRPELRPRETTEARPMRRAFDVTSPGPTRAGARLHAGDLRHARAGSGEHRSWTSSGQGLGLVEGRHRGRAGSSSTAFRGRSSLMAPRASTSGRRGPSSRTPTAPASSGRSTSRDWRRESTLWSFESGAATAARWS